MPRRGQINPAIRDEAGKIIPWKKRNKEAANVAERDRRRKSRNRIRKENRLWRERNPFATAALVANGRAKKWHAVSTLTKEEWRIVVEKRGFLCHLCGGQVSLEIGSPFRLSLDHIIPLSRGGANVKENVAPAHNHCNQKRSDMTLSEFDEWLDKVYAARRINRGESKKPLTLQGHPSS